jgi:hypothetical protein
MNPVEFCKGGREVGRYSSVDSSVMIYSPGSNDVDTEAKESPLFSAVTKQRLVKRLQAGEDLACSDL